MAKAKKKSKPAKAPKDLDDEGIPKPKLRRIRDDDDGEAKVPKSRSDIFTGLAALSLLALIGSAVFFHLDAEETTAKPLAAPSLTVPSAAVVTDVPRTKGN